MALVHHFPTTKGTKYHKGFKSTFIVVLGAPSCPLWFNPSSISLVVNQFTILFIPSLRCVTLKLISSPTFMPLSFK